MTYAEAVEALDQLVDDIKRLSKKDKAPIEALVKILEAISALYDKLEETNNDN